MRVRLDALTGTALTAALPDLARLRITVFRDWPYLYNGSIEYEQAYLRTFSSSDGAVIIAACDGDAIVGAATASPMAGQADALAQPLRARGFDVGRLFYFGESVLLPSHRGQGIGHAFFDKRETHARSIGGTSHATFCAVVRPDSHPMKPAGYRPLDAFWTRRGYRRVDGLVGSFTWRDVGEDQETAKPMQFWMKAL